MRYTYAYKTSDGTRHEASIDAESRGAVFAELRNRGIRPIKVVAADGSKANGEILGVRKRMVAAIAVVAALLAGFAVFFAQRITTSGQTDSDLLLTSLTRRQVIGDAAIIEKGLRTGWSDVFPAEGERFMASFAVPGVPAGLGSTTECEFAEALKHRVEVSEKDGIEARQIKAMVEGMKQEARRFISSGGSIQQYCRLLVARQNEEIGYYTRAKTEIEQAYASGMDREQLTDLWEMRNESLRQMGIRLIAMPD